MSAAIAKKVAIYLSEIKRPALKAKVKTHLNLKDAESENAFSILSKMPTIIKSSRVTIQFVGFDSDVDLLDVYIDAASLTPEELVRPASYYGKATPRVNFNEEPKEKIDARILFEIDKSVLSAKTSVGRLLTKREELGYVGRTYIMERCDILQKKGLLELVHVGKSNRHKLKLTKEGKKELRELEKKELIDEVHYNYEDRVVKTATRILKEMVANGGEGKQTALSLLLVDKEELGFTTKERIAKRIGVMVSQGLILPESKFDLEDEIDMKFEAQEEAIKKGEITERVNIAHEMGISDALVGSELLKVTAKGEEFLSKNEHILDDVVYSLIDED